MYLKRILTYIVALCFLTACHTTKFVGEGEYLLNSVRIQTDTRAYKSSDLKPYLRQQPNFKAFGLMKWQLYVYDWSGRNERRWINKQLRRIGEPPVILDTTLVAASADELRRFFYNKGYMEAVVTAEIDTTRAKKADVTYYIHEGTPYLIKEYAMNINDPVIDSIMRIAPPRRTLLQTAFRTYTDDYTPLVHNNIPFDRELLDKERQRLTTLLRSNGYYAFNRDYLTYIADTTQTPYMVDLDMLLRPYRQPQQDGTVIDAPHRPYMIRSVSIVTGYDPLTLSENQVSQYDTLQVGATRLLYGSGGRSIRPAVLTGSSYIRPGYPYNERAVEQTYASLTTLGALRNVNIRFTEVEDSIFASKDTMQLDCVILTSPAKTQGFSAEIEGTNNAGDLGFASSLSYQHRNLFHGSERFSAKVRGAYEALSGGQSERGSYWELGGEASILFPRFLFPFLKENFRRKVRATTELKMSYSAQARPEFHRSIVSAGWSYLWQDRTNSSARHVFKLLDIDYIHLPMVDAEFASGLPESTLLYNFTDQFILGTGYTYSFSNRDPRYPRRGTHSLRFSLETSGNLLRALAPITGASRDEEGRYNLFGIPYAQFVKADIDLAKSIVLDDRNRLAFHAGVGLGYPYGNSRMLPFERSYFAGGANSVRGWSVRSLGPGGMPADSVRSFAQQIGDIRLDLSMEYRSKLFWKLEMAAYVDAGNVWTLHADESRPRGNFAFDRFYREIAVSYGLGLRLDFDFFLLRFDTGMKAYDPQQSGRRRIALLHPNLHNNFAWHFAVGYPF